MGEIADQLIENEMFGDENWFNDKPRNKHKNKFRRTAWVHLTPAQRKIASIRKEIAILASSGTDIEEARRLMNEKYGRGWRERGLVSNSENQWSEEDLIGFT
jgi:hypothetical protein